MSAARFARRSSKGAVASDAALSRSDLNASLGLQVDRYEPSSGGRMLRLILQITEINGPLLSTVSNQFVPSFRGWFPEVRLDAELGCSYGLSPFVVASGLHHKYVRI
jgi:hypothetical protein